MTSNRGFTLIELLAVIVILGLLAGVALPKFTDLRNEANFTAAKSAYGAAVGAAQLNFAAARVGRAGVVPISDGPTLLAAMDPATRAAWSTSDGDLAIWNADRSYGVYVVDAETATQPARIIIMDGLLQIRVYPDDAPLH